jgi:peptide/nickel transport system substrate-binding protein
MRPRSSRPGPTILAALLSLVSACAPAAPVADGGATTLTVLYPGDERILSPYWEMPAKFLMFESLVRVGDDGRLEGRLAESWVRSEDGSEVTVTLRENLTWHDGVPFTTADIVFTWELWMDERVGWVPPGAVDLEVIDERSVRIASGDPRTEPLSTWAVYYPKHLLEHHDPAEFLAWDFWMEPVGNGAYRYVRHVPRTMMEFAPYDDYYDGRPAIDRLVLKFGAGGPARITELMSGEVNTVGWAEPGELRLLAGDESFRAYHSYDNAYRAIVWNTRLPQFSEPRVRRALTRAIDRRAILDGLEMPPDAPLTDSFPVGGDQLPDEALSLPHDAAEAGRLLDAAGWETGADGTRERAGQPLAFSLLVSAEDESAAVLVQQQLARVGVEASLEVAARQVIREKWASADFEAVLMILGTHRLGALFGPDGTSGYRDPVVTAGIAAADAAASPRQRRAILAELAPVIVRDQPATLLYPGTAVYIVPSWVDGLASPYRADPLRYLDRLSVRSEPAAGR